MVNGTDNPAVTLQVNGIAGGNANRRHRRFQYRRLHHLYRAARRSHSEQHRSAHHHQRRQSDGLHHPEHLGDEPDPDPHRSHADDSSIPARRPSCSPAQSSSTARRCWSKDRPCQPPSTAERQLTATVNLTEPGNLDLQVLNPAPGPATSADLIATVNGTPPVPIVSPNDAARFLEQATFGATDADIHNVSLNGFQSWLNQQFAMPPTADRAGRRAGAHRQQPALRLERRQVQRRALRAEQPGRKSGPGYLLAAVAHCARSAAPARQVRALADLRHLQQQHYRHPEHAARRSQLLRHARRRRLRQLPPAPAGRDPQSHDGPVPLHAAATTRATPPPIPTRTTRAK